MRSEHGRVRAATFGAVAVVAASLLGGCGQGSQDSTISRQQWQKVPWDLTSAQVIHRLGTTPTNETKDDCRQTGSGRYCYRSISYEFGDVTARFDFLRPARRRTGKLFIKSWAVNGKKNTISRSQYRAAIRPDTTMRQAEARLGQAEERKDTRTACELPGRSGCTRPRDAPDRCLRYGWSSGGGDRVYICFNLATGRLLSDSYLKPSPVITIRVPAG